MINLLEENTKHLQNLGKLTYEKRLMQAHEKSGQHQYSLQKYKLKPQQETQMKSTTTYPRMTKIYKSENNQLLVRMQSNPNSYVLLVCG